MQGRESRLVHALFQRDRIGRAVARHAGNAALAFRRDGIIDPGISAVGVARALHDLPGIHPALGVLLGNELLHGNALGLELGRLIAAPGVGDPHLAIGVEVDQLARRAPVLADQRLLLDELLLGRLELRIVEAVDVHVAVEARGHIDRRLVVPERNLARVFGIPEVGQRGRFLGNLVGPVHEGDRAPGEGHAPELAVHVDAGRVPELREHLVQALHLGRVDGFDQAGLDHHACGVDRGRNQVVDPAAGRQLGRIVVVGADIGRRQLTAALGLEILYKAFVRIAFPCQQCDLARRLCRRRDGRQAACRQRHGHKSRSQQ